MKQQNTHHQKTNRNVALLINLSQENHLMIANTCFQKKSGKLWTYLSDMGGTKSQLDYILINKKWKNSIKNIKAYSFFASIGSDHRVISARLKLSLRKVKTLAQKKLYNWSALSNNEELQHQYTIQIRNRYAELCIEGEDITEKYDKLIKANNETAHLLLQTREQKNKTNFANNEKVIEQRYIVQREANETNSENLQSEKAKLYRIYNSLCEEQLAQKITLIETAAKRGQCSKCWNLINDVSGYRSSKKGILKDKNIGERIRSWYSHFSHLLGKEPTISDDCGVQVQKIFEDLQIETGPFTNKEYLAVKKYLKLGKVSGEDGIPNELLKYCNIDDIVLEYVNSLLLDGHKPQQWSDILSLPKDGDFSNASNYRGIGLSAMMSKVVNKLILNRIQSQLNPLLRINQNGFRPKRNTAAHILALRRIIEEAKRNNVPATIVFVDFSKAFDSVHRTKMMQILKTYGIPNELVNAIQKL